MQKITNYSCQIPGCDRKVSIRSSVKTPGPMKGLKCCPTCKAKYDAKPKTFTPIKKVTEKTAARRKEERQGLPAFFNLMIAELKLRPFCDNCKMPIKHYVHPVNNVAHILRKSRFKSVMTDKNNIVFLCADKDENGHDCHHQFDSDISGRVNMPVFALAQEKLTLIKGKIKESGKELEIFNNGLHKL